MRCSAKGAVRCSAVRCGAVRCGAVRCGAVRCSALAQYPDPQLLTNCLPPAPDGCTTSPSATCDGFFYRERHAAVIGGGDTAMEQALFLARFCSKVTVIHRRDTFRASKAMVTRVLNHPMIEILWNTRLGSPGST